MAIRELMTNTHGEHRYCFSDISIVAALLMPCGETVKRDGVWTTKPKPLPAAELDFTYLRLMKRRKVKPPDLPPGKRPEEAEKFIANIAPSLDDRDNETVPIVCFAIKPIRGTFAVHERKRDLWRTGLLHTDTREYSKQSRKLFRMVGEVLSNYRATLQTEARTKRTAAGLIVIDADTELITPSKREVIENVRVPNE